MILAARSCEKCRRKPARLLSSHLNKALCLECYLRELERRVKRNVSASGLRGMAPLTLVPLHPILPFQSVALITVAERIERGFGRRPAIVILEGQGVPAIARGLRKLVISLDQRATELLRSEEGLFGAWRAFRSLYAAVSRRLGKPLVLLPGCSDLLAAVDVLSLLEGSEPSLENSPFFSDEEGPIIVNAFYGLPCYDVALAGVILGGDPGEFGPPPASFRRDELGVYLMLQGAISGKSYEVLVNLSRSVGELATGPRCAVCHAPSREPLCPYCHRLGSLEVRVRWENG